MVKECSARGFDVSPRQLERWIQAGLIEPARRVGLGRGRGSRSEYTDGAVEASCFVAARVRRGTPLASVGVAMFAAGQPLPEAGLRRSLIWLFETALASPFLENDHETKQLADPERTLDEVESIGRQLARRRDQFTVAARRQSRRHFQDESATAMLESAWVALILRMSGAEVSLESLGEILLVFGADALTHEWDQQSVATQFEEYLAETSLSRMARGAREAPVAELIDLRDQWLAAMQELPTLRAAIEGEPALRGSPLAASLDSLSTDVGTCLIVLSKWLRLNAASSPY